MVDHFLMLVEGGRNSLTKTKQNFKKPGTKCEGEMWVEGSMNNCVEGKVGEFNSQRTFLCRAARIPHSCAYSFPGYCPTLWFADHGEFWNPAEPTPTRATSPVMGEYYAVHLLLVTLKVLHISIARKLYHDFPLTWLCCPVQSDWLE